MTDKERDDGLTVCTSCITPPKKRSLAPASLMTYNTMVTHSTRIPCTRGCTVSVKLTLRKLRCERFDTLGHLPGQLGQMGILFK
ncbi:hypothetical protein SAMN05192562_106224 [Kosakonia arachidis]|uniref:Uncharacterized protein n=1 Tax=Kosakonia arachidis TaxID=551989 RepID=A0A1I7DT06_9ENTR|nr:hypothetical protein SAMN05192562_106224 [Kosakonia arachidis]